jgi:predicted RNase H-like HicB family nuclease
MYLREWLRSRLFSHRKDKIHSGTSVLDRCPEPEISMEHLIQLHIEKLPEGFYLATSDEVQGLIAQGRTIQETLEIARDVAKKLIEAHSGGAVQQFAPAREAFDYPLVIAT